MQKLILKFFEERIDLLSILLIFLFNLIIFNRYFPLTEGWWETYAYLLNSGLNPIKDFEIAFPPFFLYLNSMYLNFFGTDFYIFRLIGVFAFTLQSILLLILLRQYFSNFASSLSVLIAEFLFISMPIFIAKDYHTYVYIFEFLTLILFVKHFKCETNSTKVILFVLSIITLFILFLIKQNIGLILFFSMLLVLLFDKKPKRIIFIKQIIFIICFIALFIFYNIFFGFDFKIISSQNDSKGSLFTIAFRFIIDEGNNKPLINSIIVIAFFLFFKYIVDKYYFTIRFKIINSFLGKALIEFYRGLPKYLHDIFRMVILVLFVLIFSFYIKNIIVFTIATVLYVILMIYYKENKFIFYKEYLIILIPIVGISYCNTQTTTFDFGGLLLAIAFSSAYIINYLSQYVRLYLKISVAIFVSFIIIQRFQMPYYWWENAQDSIFNSKEETSYKALKGMYVDKEMKIIYDKLNKYIEDNSDTKYDCYFFNLPLLYILNEKLPPHKLVGHWFDVTPTNSLDVEYSNFTNLPKKNVIFFQSTALSFDVHKYLKRKDNLVQEKFYKKINSLVNEFQYEFIESFSIPNRDFYDFKTKNSQLTTNVILQNKDFQNMTINEFSKKMNSDSLIIEKIYRNNILIFEQKMINSDKNITLEIGDIISLKDKYVNLFYFVPKIGVQPINSALWNSVNIYKKID